MHVELLYSLPDNFFGYHQEHESDQPSVKARLSSSSLVHARAGDALDAGHLRLSTR